VVQFRSETDPGSGRVVGRIEHVASREAATFRSWAELEAFVARVLGRVPAEPTEEPG